MRTTVEARAWAEEEFGTADLGYPTRTRRVVSMAARVARLPAGRVSEVFDSDADRQAAYDLLEDSRVRAAALLKACAGATAKRSAAEPFVFVAVDGSSLTITDRRRAKNFGRVGSNARGARGLKVMTAYAVAASGVPVGIVDQSWWARPSSLLAPGKQKGKRGRNLKRKTADKETQRWLDVIEASERRLDAEGARGWFQLDREGDAMPILLKLNESRHWFTVRSRTNRRLADEDGEAASLLRTQLAKERVLGTYSLDVVASPGRRERVATMRVRAATVTLRLRDAWNHRVRTMRVTAVWAREVSSTPKGEKPLDWLLFTNRPVVTFADACAVVRGYAMRWRIEEFHKTWKSGACRVEDTQLRDKDAVIKWATILATVAARIERLKQLSRQSPEQPATIELRPVELRALVLLKRDQKKRTERVTDDPTIGEATRWLADLGGYTGKSSGGPPGSITIGRGLRRVLDAARLLELIEPNPRAK
jgi:hypothetical protein